MRPDLSRKIFDKCSDQKSRTDKGEQVARVHKRSTLEPPR